MPCALDLWNRFTRCLGIRCTTLLSDSLAATASPDAPHGGRRGHIHISQSRLRSSASVAWFIATPRSGNSYPIACEFAAESFTCKKGTFQ